MEGDKAYIKLGYRLKTPVEKWRDSDNQYFLDQLYDWRGNIGRCCGICDIVVLDIDDPHRVDDLGIKPFETRAVKTGSGGYHLYYKVPNAKKVIIHDTSKNHLGELQCMGQYVVVPPSVHPNGNHYQWLNPDCPVQELSQEELLEPFRGKCKLSDELSKPTIRWVSTDTTEDPFAKVSVEDVWNAKVNEVRGDQMFCSHPLHGSGTGHNLVIHPGKNLWKCWRCNSGGGAAMAVAVRYGVIDCSDARPGALRGDKFKETLAIAKEKGIIKEEQPMITNDIRRMLIDE